MKRDWAFLAGGLGLGTGLMYLLDPDRGKRRRAYVRDQMVHAAHVMGDAMDTTARDLKNRAFGLAAEARGRLRPDHPSDQVLVARVRSEIGRVVSHPHAIDVRADNGRILLSGPILSHEVDDLISTVCRVRGVRDVVNELETHQKPGDVPGLQGSTTRPARYDLAQSNWAPATRALVGAAGGAMAAYGVARRDVPGALMSLVGAGMLARATTNTEMKRLLGVGGGRRAVDLRKTINIHASPEEVFEYCTHYENFPRYMSHVRQVKDSGHGQSHWVVDGPGGIPVSWDAVVTECIPGKVFAWKTMPGAMVEHAGIMRFDRNPDGSMRLDIRFSYNPPAGAIGHAVATLFGANPKRQMDADFARLKSIIEEGKTTAHGEEIQIRRRAAA